jgi:hypothetical protein
VRATCSCRGAVFLSEGVSEPHRVITTHRWMVTSPRRVSLLLRVFVERWRCYAYWVSAEPLCRFLRPKVVHRGRIGPMHSPRVKSDSEASTPPPSPSLTEGCVLSRALAPFQGFTDACRVRAGSIGLLRSFQRVHAFRGFCPYSVFPDTGSDESHLRHPVPLACVCARRVSHPLDALLPPWPAELVSSRSRSWG